MHVEVLGFDCAACRKTFRLIEETAREQGRAIRLEKVDDPARIAACRVLAVPASSSTTSWCIPAGFRTAR